jgi:hypothetical protein
MKVPAPLSEMTPQPGRMIYLVVAAARPNCGHALVSNRLLRNSAPSRAFRTRFVAEQDLVDAARLAEFMYPHIEQPPEVAPRKPHSAGRGQARIQRPGAATCSLSAKLSANQPAQ